MRRHLYLATAAMAWLVPSMACAQQAGSAAGDALEAEKAGEIIVTAQRRSERLQDVPVAITNLDSVRLVKANIQTLQDLPRIAPTLKGGNGPGTSGVRLSIRGLGSLGNSAIEPSVATFVDGVYIARPGAMYGALLDLDAVEVLSGPQGTLFGRNASVGALNIRTKAPSDHFEGNLGAEAGTGERYRLDGAVNLPLGQDIALRVAGLAQLFNGYWKTTGTGGRSGVDNFAGRATLRAKLSDKLTWTGRGDYTLTRGGGWQYTPMLANTLTPTTLATLTARIGAPVDLDPQDRTTNQYTAGNHIDSKHWGVSSQFDLELGDFALKLTDSYRDWDNLEQDGDGSFLPILLLARDNFWRSKSNAHELQLSSPTDLLGGRFSFVSGLYYYREDLRINYNFNLSTSFCSIVAPSTATAACLANPRSPAALFIFNQKTSSIAGYLQGTLKIVPTLDLTLGARYTHDDKDGSFVGQNFNPAAASIQTNETTALSYGAGRWTYRANLAWRPSRELMLFATYSTGFKSGGFNSGNSNTALGQLRVFNPELVSDYELGFKFQTRDRILTFNATAYRMDVDNFQERALFGITPVVQNVGSLRQQGIEAEITLKPVEGFQLNTAIAYLDSQFKSYPNAPNVPGFTPATHSLSGFPLTFSPKFAGTSGIEYSTPIGGDMRISLRGDISYTTKHYAGTTIDGNPLTIQPGYSLLSARATLYGRDDNWSVALFGDNLADKRYCTNIAAQVFDAPLGLRNTTTGTGLRCFVGNPRTWGVRMAKNF